MWAAGAERGVVEVLVGGRSNKLIYIRLRVHDAVIAKRQPAVGRSGAASGRLIRNNCTTALVYVGSIVWSLNPAAEVIEWASGTLEFSRTRKAERHSHQITAAE